LISKLKHLLSSNYIIKIIPNNSKLGIILFTIYYKDPINKNIYKIHFHDSYLLLPSKLSELAKSFELNENKGIFPYKFMDSYDKINYIGIKPEPCYYELNKLPDDYHDIKSWNAKDETLKYIK
jgi:hypothetical protein